MIANILEDARNYYDYHVILNCGIEKTPQKIATTYKTLADLEKMVEWGYMDGFKAVMQNLDELFASLEK